MTSRRFGSICAVMLLLLAIAKPAYANLTNTAYVTAISDIYVMQMEVHITGNAANYNPTAPYLDIKFAKLDGTSPDLCSDMTGAQTSAQIHPSSGNKDLMISLLQFAYLNQKKVNIRTEAILQTNSAGTSTMVCYIKHIWLFR